MIRVVFECDGTTPIAFHHNAVAGVRARASGRVFQILEGPETAVMLAVAVLADQGAHLARSSIRDRSLPDWRVTIVDLHDLPKTVFAQVASFVLVTEPNETQPDASQVVGFLSSLVDAQPQPAITSGRRLMSKVGGQAGARAWIAV